MTLTPKITTTRRWSADKVQQVCIEAGLYCNGSNEDYDKMLDMVRRLEPTIENIYTVAADIKRHSSKYWPISSIMFSLEAQAVTTTFTVDGEEE